jgi:hypothetical protein
MRLHRGDCAAVGGPHARGTDFRGCGAAAIICAVFTALRPDAPRALRFVASAADHRDDFQPFQPFTKRAQQSCHASCGPPSDNGKSVRCSASEDFRGGFALAE